MGRDQNEIPVIDLRLHDSVAGLDDIELLEEVTDSLCNGLKKMGFVYLINHGIPEEKVNRAFQLSRQYFDLPTETKRKTPYSVDTLAGHLLYGNRFIKRHGEVEYRESYDRALCRNVHPPEIPDLEDASNELVDDLVGLGKLLTKLIAEGLGLPYNSFAKGHSKLYKEGNLSMFRILHYPPMTDIADEITRCGVHTDFDTFTLLLQDEIGGLKTKNEDGGWVQATPIPGSILMNVGDLLEIWTGGQIRAIEHAVTRPTDPDHLSCPRYSMGLFFIPDDDAFIEPLVGDKEKYQSTTPKDYVFNRLQRFYN